MLHCVFHNKIFITKKVFFPLRPGVQRVADFPQNTDIGKKNSPTSSQTSTEPISPHPPESSQGSYEVFLLFARSLVAVLLVGVLSWSQLSCRPVVAFVVAEIPVKQEAQSSYRQQDENDNHWKKWGKNVFFKMPLWGIKAFRISCESYL